MIEGKEFHRQKAEKDKEQVVIGEWIEARDG
jgi:hypothetical protein